MRLFLHLHRCHPTALLVVIITTMIITMMTARASALPIANPNSNNPPDPPGWNEPPDSQPREISSSKQPEKRKGKDVWEEWKDENGNVRWEHVNERWEECVDRRVRYISAHPVQDSSIGFVSHLSSTPSIFPSRFDDDDDAAPFITRLMI